MDKLKTAFVVAASLIIAGCGTESDVDCQPKPSTVRISPDGKMALVATFSVCGAGMGTDYVSEQVFLVSAPAARDVPDERNIIALIEPSRGTMPGLEWRSPHQVKITVPPFASLAKYRHSFRSVTIDVR